MNQLSLEQRGAVLRCLIEGNSVSSTARITGVSKNAILRLLMQIGNACIDHHDKIVRNVRSDRIECDEIWSFTHTKKTNLPDGYEGADRGDTWTWVALDPDTKFVPSWVVGPRDWATCKAFMHDLAGRLANRIQLSTDGLRYYPGAAEEAFGWNGADMAQLEKQYAPDPDTAKGRKGWQDACVGVEKKWIMGTPDADLAGTSYVERGNLTMRMSMRRFTRKTNGFSKKFENHCSAVALYFTWYNWCRVHMTLTRDAGGIHTTPGMAMGLTNRVHTMDELILSLT